MCVCVTTHTSLATHLHLAAEHDASRFNAFLTNAGKRIVLGNLGCGGVYRSCTDRNLNDPDSQLM